MAVGVLTAGALLVPLAIFIAAVPGDQIDFIPAPTVHAFAHVLDSLAGHGGPVLLFVVGLLGLASIVVLIQAWRGPDRDQAWPIVLALSWLIVPVVVAFVVSLAKPIVQAEYLLVSLPGLLLLAAVGLEWLIETKGRAGPAVAAVALLVLGGRSVIQVYRHGADENWRGATALVMAEGRPTDGLIFAVSDERTPFEYYAARLGYPSNAPVPLYPTDAYRHLRPQSVQTPRYTATALDALLAGRSRIWVLQRAANGDIGEPRLRLPVERYTLAERRPFTDVDVTLYRLLHP